jgi:hypothetical protein
MEESQDIETPTDTANETITRQDVLKSIKRYYDMKTELLMKKIEMIDKLKS